MRVLGLDVGIASVGWWLLPTPDPSDSVPTDPDIGFGGVWLHNPPEDRTQSGTKLRSEARRLFRGQRRVIRRRRQRMNAVRRLLADHGLLVSADRDALRGQGCDPWTLRAQALERVLEAHELAAALGHIARHRGYKSNAKDGGKNDGEGGKVIKSTSANKEKSARFSSIAQMLLEDDSFVLRETRRRDGSVDTVRRLRNREGDYSRSLLRDDLALEVRDIFKEQRRLGNAMASDELEEAFTRVAFFQRPLQDSEHMVASCPFEPEEKRATKRGYSFEWFRYLARLNNLNIVQGRSQRRLNAEDIARASADFGATAKISFSALRKKIGLASGELFEGVKEDEEGKRDVVARSGEAAAGTARLRKLIVGSHGEMTWRSLLDNRPEVLDKVAEVISFRSDPASIAAGLSEIELDSDIRDTLQEAVRGGELDIFVGAGHISAKAARRIVTGLLQGLTYDKACIDAGYDHTASREKAALDVGAEGKEALARLIKEQRISRDIIGSPTARHALLEAIKQVKAIVEVHGMPDRIHIELARDVGKSIEERDEISRGIEKRNKQKEKLRVLFAEEVGRPLSTGRAGAEEMSRFELWQQQNGRCVYTDSYISPAQLIADDNSVQVDHILPWSRFGDDSFHNKTLCIASANQNKRNLTPFEWVGQDSEQWDAFVARVKELSYLKGMKRRNYLLQNADEVAEKFRARNLNDTRWSCRLLAEALRQVLPDLDEGKVGKDGKAIATRRVFVRPGALTDRLRRAWGLQFFKKDEKLKRILDDRHHALDALITAATTESRLNRMTVQMQREERERCGQTGPTGRALSQSMSDAMPWDGFREQALDALSRVFVARAPRMRARGKAHDATIRQIRERDGKEVVFERKRVADLKISDLDRVKDADRNAAVIASLRNWIDAGSPKDKDRQPLSPKGDPISKIRLESRGKVAIRLHSGGSENRPGAVDRGEMARVDVFTKLTPKGAQQYFLVPIYPHEIAGGDKPPNRAVTAYKPEDEWLVLDETYEFLWSITPMTLLKVVDRNGTVFFDDQVDGNLGYFRGFDRATGAIALSSLVNQAYLKTGIGARTLNTFQKMSVDRLGLVFAVGREKRTWRGEVCI